MKLGELLCSAGIIAEDKCSEFNDIDIKRIVHDSRKVQPGDLFICIVGEKNDGHEYVPDVEKKGAAALVVSRQVETSLPAFLVEDTRSALARIAGAFYNIPEDMKLYAVTGTNGKTTVTFFFRSILKAAGLDCGVIGTTGIYFADKVLSSENTTPDTLEIFDYLRMMYDAGVRNVIIEASSQGLDMHRLDCFKFCSSAFTNITQEHLYYHKTFENYFRAKAKLFDLTSGYAVLNMEDKYYSRLKEIVHVPVISYGYSEKCNIYPTQIETTLTDSHFLLHFNDEVHEVHLKIPFGYNILNALAAAGLAYSQGIPAKTICEGLNSLKYIPGRVNFLNQRPLIIVDFAHTPHGLQNFLKEIRGRRSGRLITVFGCIGERDIEKRKYMAKAANKYSDLIIFTTDNPRNEDPDEIAKCVIPYFTKDYIIEHDRKKAILTAFKYIKEDDILVILGKGHETYQIIGDKKVEHNDEVIVKEFLRGRQVSKVNLSDDDLSMALRRPQKKNDQ